MAINNEIIQTNAEAVEIFAKLEKMSKEQPDVFQFFLSRYGTDMLTYFDWGNALWNVDEKPAGALDKFMPYITAVLSILILAVVFLKK
jgi:hypothetical protein